MSTDSDEAAFRPPNATITPVCWPWLNALGGHSALDELTVWVDWARERYALATTEVPPCWERHGALVEELSALRTAWLAAFAADAQPTQPLRWHEAFDLARRRLQSWTAHTGCADTNACSAWMR